MIELMLKIIATQIIVFAVGLFGDMCTDEYSKANWIFESIVKIMSCLISIEVTIGVMWGIWTTNWI